MPDAIFGRDEALAALVRFVEDARTGPRAMVLEGDAGIGKTTLWREAVRHVENTHVVLSSRASDVETRMSFATLGDLLVPALNESIGNLPAVQRDALEAALLLGQQPRMRPDARAVSLAVLGLLRTLASETPFAIAIDDVQWVDGQSARALAFALRRLEDVPFLIITAERTGSGSSDPLDILGTLRDRVDRLAIGPIAPGPLGKLLRQRLGNDFPPLLVRRIHEASRGNPFFALEIGRAVRSEGVLPREGEPLPVPANLRELLRRQLTALPGRVRDGLLLVASSPQATMEVEAVEELAGGLAEAEDAGIVRTRATVFEFSHPLFASTVYEMASGPGRRTAHAALANITKDQEERVRHLALASTGPDQEVALALDEAAKRAMGRGAPLAATELFQLAAALTPLETTEALRVRRLRSAHALFAGGDVRGARQLAERSLAESAPGPSRARAMYSISFMSWNDLHRVRGLLLQALREVGRDAYIRGLILGDLAWVDLDACDPASAIPRARAAVELAEGTNEPSVLRNALAALAMSKAVLGEDPKDLLARGISEEGALSYGEVATPRICLGRFQMWEGALDAARETLLIELGRYREQGHESASWDVRAYLAEVEYRAGDWRRAVAHAIEAYEIVIEAGWADVVAPVAAVRSMIEAAEGRHEAARASGIEALSVSERTGDVWSEIKARAALGFLELSNGDAAAAHGWLAPAVLITERMNLREPGAFPFVPDGVESLVGVGDLEAAERLTDRLDEHGVALDRPLALATAARCRGVLAATRGDLEQADRHLQRALREHERCPHPFELGRTLLLAGAVRRRMRQKKGARDLLQWALTTFDGLGAPLWSERARRELERIGGRAPSPMALTPAEEQIALLVSEGKTNREVAEALFISVNTVESNLKRIYRKLDVRSRTELARRL